MDILIYVVGGIYSIESFFSTKTTLLVARRSGGLSSFFFCTVET